MQGGRPFRICGLHAVKMEPTQENWTMALNESSQTQILILKGGFWETVEGEGRDREVRRGKWRAQ